MRIPGVRRDSKQMDIVYLVMAHKGGNILLKKHIVRKLTDIFLPEPPQGRNAYIQGAGHDENDGVYGIM